MLCLLRANSHVFRRAKLSSWGSFTKFSPSRISPTYQFHRLLGTVQNHPISPRHSLVLPNDQPLKFSSDQSVFSDLRSSGLPYFDRTRYISVLDSIPGDHLLFLRPRRFGKSLTLSMLEQFHGLQYKPYYESLFGGLDIARDVKDGKITPNQYLILKLDFSKVSGASDPDESLTNMIINALKTFYASYAPYLGMEKKQLIDGFVIESDALTSLDACVRIVKNMLFDKTDIEWKDHPLAGVKGIYVLIDEYDTVRNAYIDSDTFPWMKGYPQKLLEDLYSTIRACTGPSMIRKVFITGIEPVTLTGPLKDGLNMEINVSFEPELSGLCGITHGDAHAALRRLLSDGSVEKELSSLTDFVNGYRFCPDNNVDIEPVFNTAVCLNYFQRCLEDTSFNLHDPPRSKIDETFLKMCVSSPIARNSLEEALRQNSDGTFSPIKYSELTQRFGLTYMGAALKKQPSAWQSLLLYHGGLTFDSKDPSKHMKIANHKVARRIAAAILDYYGVDQNDVDQAVEIFASTGNITDLLTLYQHGLTGFDWESNFSKNGELHANTFDSIFLRNPCSTFKPKFAVKTGRSYKDEARRVDLVIMHPRHVTGLQWKTIPLNDLEIKNTFDAQSKAYALDNITNVNELLDIKINRKDQTIKDWIYATGKDSQYSQVQRFVRSLEIIRICYNGEKLRGYLVVVVGDRKVLLCEMGTDGQLKYPPRLLEYRKLPIPKF
ncbi:hypothetical protein EDC01DRAFT_764735 [Geopyxis carbonaria]|nr:hypothetical protein EDC01DRAFT_764735 [Geopyxis carbonaria]